MNWKLYTECLSVYGPGQLSRSNGYVPAERTYMYLNIHMKYQTLALIV